MQSTNSKYGSPYLSTCQHFHLLSSTYYILHLWKSFFYLTQSYKSSNKKLFKITTYFSIFILNKQKRPLRTNPDPNNLAWQPHPFTCETYTQTTTVLAIYCTSRRKSENTVPKFISVQWVPKKLAFTLHAKNKIGWAVVLGENLCHKETHAHKRTLSVVKSLSEQQGMEL